MEITSEPAAGGITIVRLAGDMRLSSEQRFADRLRDVVGAAIIAGSRKVILSLTDVSRIDSRGIGAIARCEASAITQRAEILLVMVPGSVQDALVRLNFIQVCSVYPTEAAALEAASAASPS